MKDIAKSVLMVRPANFGWNEQTAVNNYYQNNNVKMMSNTIQLMALKEFDSLVDKVRALGVEVIVVEDTKDLIKPDAIFPNNWISFHEGGTVGVYPMFAENRRYERREDVLELLEHKAFMIDEVIDYTAAEDEQLFLEGTGSLVLDRNNKIAYAAISARTDEDLVIEFCEDFEYTPIIFTANQRVEGELKPIYHTNVMMSITEHFAVVCINAITDKKERKMVLRKLRESGKEIIAITESQVTQFAGNMLQVLGENGKKYVVMSTAAENSLTIDQRRKIEENNTIISSSLETIERFGGGSARCMMAEVFLSKA